MRASLNVDLLTEILTEITVLISLYTPLRGLARNICINHVYHISKLFQDNILSDTDKMDLLLLFYMYVSVI